MSFNNISYKLRNHDNSFNRSLFFRFRDRRYCRYNLNGDFPYLAWMIPYNDNNYELEPMEHNLHKRYKFPRRHLRIRRFLDDMQALKPFTVKWIVPNLKTTPYNITDVAPNNGILAGIKSNYILGKVVSLIPYHDDDELYYQ